MYTYAPSLLNHPPTFHLPLEWRSHSSRLSQSTGFELLVSYGKFPPPPKFTYGNAYVSMLSSQFIPPSPSSSWVCKSILHKQIFTENPLCIPTATDTRVSTIRPSPVYRWRNQGFQTSSNTAKIQTCKESSSVLLDFKLILTLLFNLNLNRNFPGCPITKTLPFNAEDVGLIPGLGANIPHVSQPKNQNVK